MSVLRPGFLHCCNTRWGFSLWLSSLLHWIHPCLTKQIHSLFFSCSASLFHTQLEINRHIPHLNMYWLAGSLNQGFQQYPNCHFVAFCHSKSVHQYKLFFVTCLLACHQWHNRVYSTECHIQSHMTNLTTHRMLYGIKRHHLVWSCKQMTNWP